MIIPWTSVVGTLLVVETMVQLWLTQRQRRTLRAHRNQVPTAFAAQLTLEQHQKAADYGEARLRLDQLKRLWTLGLVLLLIFSGVLGNWDARLFDIVPGQIRQPLAFLGLIGFLSWVVNIPWSWYSHFKLEDRFGFNRMTPRIFWADQLKSLLLSAALGALILTPFFWLMKSYGPMWIVPALLIWVGFQLLIMGVGIKLIAPLFNKFTPLQNAELSARIKQLVETAGFHADGVFVMDASKRSGHGNAYFTGIGRHKRIVFFDTLLDKISHAQILAVLAHEVGHLKHGHIWKGFAVSVVFSSLGFLGLGWLQSRGDFFVAFHLVPTPGPLLLMAGILGPLVTFPLTPLFSWRSRSHEYQADRYAVGVTSAKDLGDALLSLHRDNASSVVVDPIYSAVYFSHPPLAERLKAMGY